MISPRSHDTKSSSGDGSSAGPALIDAFTSALLRGESASPAEWLLGQGAAADPATLVTFLALDLLVRNRGVIGRAWTAPATVESTPSSTESFSAFTPLMSDETEPLGKAGGQAAGHLEDRAWLLTHQLEPLGFLDVAGGGMGAVALARHTKMRKEVVLKVANKPHLQERFRREIEVNAKLGHENIVVSRTPLEHRGTSILVVDYVRGLALSRWVELNGKMAWPEAADCICQAARGLGHAHSRGVIHRDVKPGNLIRSSRDGVVSVIDWGLALDIESRDHDDLTLTTAGQFLGTPMYCPPEQAEDPSDATPASDLYGLGCVWYELLTGEPPFPSTRENPRTLANLKEAHARETIPTLPADLEVPEAVERVLRRLLDKIPSQRYPSAAALIADLDEARRQANAGPVRDPRRGWMALAAVAALALVAWVTGSWPAEIPKVIDPAAKEAPVPLPPVEYQGECDVHVTLRGGVVVEERPVLGGGIQSLRDDEAVYITAKLIKPPSAYFYVLQIDSRGKARAVYPEGWGPGRLPPSETARADLRFPPVDENPMERGAPPGLETLIWFVRPVPLTAADNALLWEVSTGKGSAWVQPKKFDKIFVPFENGERTVKRGFDLTRTVGGEDPVSQTERILLTLKDRNVAAYSRAICYPFVAAPAASSNPGKDGQ